VTVVRFEQSGYLARPEPGAYTRGRYGGELVLRDWWLVKQNATRGYARLGLVYFPKEFIGKKVRFKVEVVSQ
jgi:hypothetical protein